MKKLIIRYHQSIDNISSEFLSICADSVKNKSFRVEYGINIGKATDVYIKKVYGRQYIVTEIELNKNGFIYSNGKKDLFK